MFVIVCYDIADECRLRRVAREAENFGTRVQKSVFECRIDDAALAELQQRIAHLIDPLADQVRYYRLCQKDVEAIVFDGPGSVTADWVYGIV